MHQVAFPATDGRQYNGEGKVKSVTASSRRSISGAGAGVDTPAPSYIGPVRGSSPPTIGSCGASTPHTYAQHAQPHFQGDAPARQGTHPDV